MFLFRLLGYFLIGHLFYRIYQMYQSSQGGMGSHEGGQGHGGRRELDRALERDTGRMNRGTLSGPGRGTAEETTDISGTSSRHLVGRGVVS